MKFLNILSLSIALLGPVSAQADSADFTIVSDENYYDEGYYTYSDTPTTLNNMDGSGGCGGDTFIEDVIYDDVYLEIDGEGTSLSVPIPPVSNVPPEVPFGALARMKALSSVTGYTMQVSISGKPLGTGTGYFGVVKSMIDIEKSLAKATISYVVEDPRREIMLETRLVNSVGEEILYSQNNFKLKQGQVPEGAKHLFFWFRNGLWIDVPGAENASVLNSKGLGATLVVENGRIFLPEWVLNNYTDWDTLQIQFVGGFVQKYDHTGKKVIPVFAQTQVESMNVDGFERVVVQNGLYQSSNFGYWWNPIVELTNPSTGWVTLDVNRDGEWWDRPVSVFITTPEDLQKGLGWKVIYNYDPKTDDVVTESVSIPLENKTYYIYFQWDDSSWGKG